MSNTVVEKSYEERRIEFEDALNNAMDRFFNARHGLTRSKVQEKIFEGGFRMAWEICKEPENS